MRRASGDPTASSLISWTLFPYVCGSIAPLVKQKQIRVPAPSGAVRAVSCKFTPKSGEATTRVTVVDSRRAPEPWCS